MNKITWTNERRKLSQLIPWPINPATIGKDEACRLEESLEKFGQVLTIAISPSNEIYDGHQRQTVWGASKKFGMEYEVDVRVSSRELTLEERKQLTIYLRKGAVGVFDMDILTNNWEVPDLLDWGFKPYELGILGEGNDPNAEWKGMPEFEQEDLGGIQSIHVHFKTREDVESFSELIGQSLTEKTRSIWFPEVEHIDMKSELYREQT